jgi:hypothetical protein
MKPARLALRVILALIPAAADAGSGSASASSSHIDAVLAPARGAPPGWMAVEDDDADCGIYVPNSRNDLPPPIRWEACPLDRQTSDLVCRRMVLDGEPPAGPEWVTPATRAIRRTDGSLALMTARFHGHRVYRIVAGLDGPTIAAVLETSSRCTLTEEGGDGDRYVYRVFTSLATGTLSEYGGGVLGGSLNDFRPRLVHWFHDDQARSFVAGDPSLLEITADGRLISRIWDGSSAEREIWSADRDGGLQQNYAFFHGSALFWAVDSFSFNGQRVFTERGGVKALLDPGTDPSYGMADLGTDGVNLVWAEGKGRTNLRDPFPTVSVAISPFTTDPSAVRPQTLRIDLDGYGFGTSPFRVGCGYATRFLTNPQASILVVRLTDGAAARLSTRDTGRKWIWSEPLAVTCEEVIAMVRVEDHLPLHSTIVRVPLNSLRWNEEAGRSTLAK